MMRLINIVLVTIMLAGAGVVYYMKYEAERSAGNLSRLQRSIVQEREAIATLNAEWSLLNQPRRLQEFAERYHPYLELDRMAPDQIAEIDDIPFRNPETADPNRTIAKIIANTKTGDITGAIKKPGDKPGDKTSGKSGDKLAQSAPKTIEPRANDPLIHFLPKGDATR
jgi:hypothetical protein